MCPFWKGRKKRKKEKRIKHSIMMWYFVQIWYSIYDTVKQVFFKVLLVQCLYGVQTLHWQSVHSVPCLTQEEPLKRIMPCSSSQVLVMSFRMLWARHGSVTQRGQHSPSGTMVKSQCAEGHNNGQQSTSPCCSPHNTTLHLIPHRQSLLS